MGGRRESPLFGAVDLREIVRILRRRSRIIAVTSITVVVLAIIFVSVVGPVYTATSTVLIDPRRTNVIDTNNQAVSSSFGSDDAVTESQALLIQSVSLLQLVVERLKLADDPEFAPPPGIVDTIKGLFPSSDSAPGARPEDVAKSKAVERLQKRLKVARQRTTFLIDINGLRANRQRPPPSRTRSGKRIFSSRSVPSTMRRRRRPTGSISRSRRSRRVF